MSLLIPTNLRNKLEVRIVTDDVKMFFQHHIWRIINCVTYNKYLQTLFIIHYSFLKNVKPLVLFQITVFWRCIHLKPKQDHDSDDQYHMLAYIFCNYMTGYNTTNRFA